MAIEILVTPLSVTGMLCGEIDHHSAAEIRRELDAVIQQHAPTLLRLDFEQVSFIDSSAVGLVLGRFRLMQELGGRLQVVNLNERYYKVMQLAGVERLRAVSLRKASQTTTK